MIKKLLGFLNLNTIIGIVVVLIIGYGTYLFKQNIALKKDNERIGLNFQNSRFQVDSLKTKNGELAYYAKGLTLKQNELENFDNKLVKQIESIGLKLKNLEGLATINYYYIYNIDTTKVIKLSATEFQSTYKDAWLDLSQRINLDTTNNTIKVSDLKLQLTDSLLMPFLIDYKRVWIFWKKPIGVSIYARSRNPHFHINQLQYIKLIK